MPQNSRSTFPRLAGPIALGAAIAAGARLAIRAARRVDFAGKTVVISGGSRGLGLELARGFAAEGAHVVLLARAEQELERAAAELSRAGARVTIVVCDVSQRRQVHDAMATILAERGGIDVLVNNAGTIQVGPLENMELDDYANALAVHFWGPLFLTREVIPAMRARGAGRIVNIASIGGQVAVPHLSPYVASKFALVGLSQSLRAELLKDGIYVTTVCPGLMRTGSHLNAYFKGQRKKEYALFSISNASPLLSTASDAAARRIIEACRFGRASIVITPQAKLLRLANSLFPNLTAEALALINRVLPGSAGPDGDRLQRGAESRSPITQSPLTRLADRAAERNNELAGSEPEQGLAANGSEERAELRCSCAHATHFLGHCRNPVAAPETLCADCMENHFQRIDDPAI